MKIKNLLAQCTYKISPRLCLTLSYLHNRGKLPNFSNPQDLSEIIFSQILSGEINNYAPYVDKIKVRDFYEQWGLSEFLPQLYGVWNTFDEIDFNQLPDRFALKSNNGCSGNYICRGKQTFDEKKARLIIDHVNSKPYSLTETQYNYIESKIYCEEYLEDPKYLFPIDYKFMCCDGEVRCILVCANRGINLKLKTYSKNWLSIDYIRSSYKWEKELEKPINLERMIEIATDIAKKFVQVRVDMYNINGRIYLGELTFTPQGGMMSYYTNAALVKLGHKNV